MWLGLSCPKCAEIGEQVVQIRHGEVDARDFGSSSERCFSHVEQRVLHAHAVMRGKFLEQDGDNSGADFGEFWGNRDIVPRDGRTCPEDAVGRRVSALSGGL